jgi:dsRNA-specific ribonuclease
MFKTTQENIPQIKATIKAYGECWFHGCGNIYADVSASDFRQKFTNPNSEEAIYRIHFTSVSQVPATLEDLNKALMSSRSQEIVKEKMPKAAQTIKTISVEAEDPAKGKRKSKKELEAEAEEAELQKLIDEENANKGI